MGLKRVWSRRVACKHNPRAAGMASAKASWVISMAPLYSQQYMDTKITIFNGKTHYKWPFSIAMLVYQTVIEQTLAFKHWDHIFVCIDIFQFKESFFYKHCWLVVWNINFMVFHSVGNFIFPTDFHSIIFQRGRLKPPTRLETNSICSFCRVETQKAK